MVKLIKAKCSEAINCYNYCSYSRPAVWQQMMLSPGWQWLLPLLQVLQNSGSQMFMLTVKRAIVIFLIFLMKIKKNIESTLSTAI